MAAFDWGFENMLICPVSLDFSSCSFFPSDFTIGRILGVDLAMHGHKLSFHIGLFR